MYGNRLKDKIPMVKKYYTMEMMWWPRKQPRILYILNGCQYNNIYTWTAIVVSSRGRDEHTFFYL